MTPFYKAATLTWVIPCWGTCDNKEWFYVLSTQVVSISQHTRRQKLVTGANKEWHLKICQILETEIHKHIYCAGWKTLTWDSERKRTSEPQCGTCQPFSLILWSLMINKGLLCLSPGSSSFFYPCPWAHSRVTLSSLPPGHASDISVLT